MTRTAEVSSERLPGTDEGLFVYGVVRAGFALPEGLVGLDDRPVGTVVCGEVAAAVSPAALVRPPGRSRELLAYSRTLDALSGAGAVVPVRFGAIVPDEQTVVEEFLAPDQEHFAEVLADLVGRSQFMVQASYLEQVVLSEVVAADPEIAELRELTRELPEDAAYGQRVRLGELVAHAVAEKQSHDAALLLDRILPLADDHVVRPVSGLDRVVDAALLVEDARRVELEDVLEELAEAVHERMRVRLVGPTAPYDFVEGG